MRNTAIRILKLLKKGQTGTRELASELDKSQSWISNVVGDLEGENLVVKDGKVRLANTYEASLLTELLDKYDLEAILGGKREKILKELSESPRTVDDLESQGFPKSTVYEALKDLKTAGAAKQTDEGYRITDETLKRFTEARNRSGNETSYQTNGERVIITEKEGGEEDRPTAFSAYTVHGVEYYPNKTYLYRGDREPGPEDALIHSVLCAENKKQMAMCGVFYLKNKVYLEPGRLWKLSRKWKCTERWADLLAFLDRREVKRKELFLSWSEFVRLAEEYDISPRGKHPQENLTGSLEEVGERLEREIEAYVLGGTNLILRGLKDTTKDIDIVLGNKKDFEALVQALERLGYEEKVKIKRSYEEMEPKTVMEREGFPRWDVFVKEVGGILRLTRSMRGRSTGLKKVGKLNLRMISPTDIFLFKAVTDREGDLEDAALIARKEKIDWQEMLEEIRKQERLTDRNPSFAVLDTLDILKKRYGIEVPIQKRLTSYCLEKALMFTLEERKTIKQLRNELDFPEHQIYNKLRKLEQEDRIEVDRGGKLNEYRIKEENS